MKTQILFVDDDTLILQGLNRMLRPMRDTWEMTFVDNGFEALAQMAKKPFDVVVSDMRMQEMSGVELLDKIKKEYPQAVRIILSGQSEKEDILKSVKSAHQYLSKPCDPGALKTTINRAVALRDLLRNGRLRRIISGMGSLPSIPSLYIEVVEQLNLPECSIRRVGETIANDLGMTAKILQLVNSAFFGIPRHVSDTTQAVSFLGLDTVKALILSIGIFSKFEQSASFHFEIEPLLRHSIKTGAIAKEMAIKENFSKHLADEAFMAGVLHDVGKLVLAANMPEQYDEILERAGTQKIPHVEAEQQVLGVTHSAVGAYLMGLWGMPNTTVETIAFHHSPMDYPADSLIPLTIVHVADGLEHYGNQSASPETPIPNIDYRYLDKLGLTERMPLWHKIGVQLNLEGKNDE
ncbi:MAG: response regulator [Desulfobacterales bacterium]|nr:response regulator [Desulfobacterales bacterium]